jgi:cell division protein FtsB
VKRSGVQEFRNPGVPRSAPRASRSDWHRINRMMIFGISLGMLGIIGAKFWPEVEKLNRLHVQTRALAIREAQLSLTRDRLRKEYERIRDDSEYLELVARDRLDLLKPGETVFRFVDRKP